MKKIREEIKQTKVLDYVVGPKPSPETISRNHPQIQEKYRKIRKYKKRWRKPRLRSTPKVFSRNHLCLSPSLSLSQIGLFPPQKAWFDVSLCLSLSLPSSLSQIGVFPPQKAWFDVSLCVSLSLSLSLSLPLCPKLVSFHPKKLDLTYLFVSLFLFLSLPSSLSQIGVFPPQKAWFDVSLCVSLSLSLPSSLSQIGVFPPQKAWFDVSLCLSLSLSLSLRPGPKLVSFHPEKLDLTYLSVSLFFFPSLSVPNCCLSTPKCLIWRISLCLSFSLSLPLCPKLVSFHPEKLDLTYLSLSLSFSFSLSLRPCPKLVSFHPEKLDLTYLSVSLFLFLFLPPSPCQIAAFPPQNAWFDVSQIDVFPPRKAWFDVSLCVSLFLSLSLSLSLPLCPKLAFFRPKKLDLTYLSVSLFLFLYLPPSLSQIGLFTPQKAWFDVQRDTERYIITWWKPLRG